MPYCDIWNESMADAFRCRQTEQLLQAHACDHLRKSGAGSLRKKYDDGEERILQELRELQKQFIQLQVPWSVRKK